MTGPAVMPQRAGAVRVDNWWRRRELNPRPKSGVRSIYERSARFS